ncbi:substrate binding domain-containing protein [Ruegeria sp. 2205SS24-7]|uniref:substrate binding domain-containing protein n=1 Tax=Ruegeria discodermiae TaxID=3064389 RepID=UPI0027410DAB|nr:substrate binding domain-containing protein [Ruegeria sp. 2205SS24-7]MDP5219933.1 substrate binding domain-containing protein [Ruegeria sp. 2205SS24-7]
MGIRAGHLSDSSVIAHRLADVRSVIVASPDYLKAHRTPQQPDDLLGHNCLHYTYSRDPKEWVFSGLEGEIAVKTRGTLRINNSEALCKALMDGLGIGRLPTFVASSHIQSGQLVRLLPEYALPEQALYAIFPERSHVPAKVRAFTDHLVDRLGGDIASWDKLQS